MLWPFDIDNTNTKHATAVLTETHHQRDIKSSVGLLAGRPGFDSWQGKRFLSSPEPTRPPTEWLSGALSRGHIGRGVKLTTDFHVVPRSRTVDLYLHRLIVVCLHGVVLN
jgi:hypothetical protein